MFSSKILVHRDGGPDFTVTVDQRDIAAAEAAEGIDSDRHAITRHRYIVWNAAKRSGAYVGTWEAFNTRDCIEAEIVDDQPESEGEQEGLDPGRSTSSDGA